MSDYVSQPLFPEVKKNKRQFIRPESFTEKRGKSWPYKPNTIQIELVQGCNRHCSFCGCRGIETAFHFAEVETTQHVCSLIAKAGLNSRILLAGHGEPTLHRQIAQIIQIIRKTLPGNMIHLFTNGTIIEKHPSLVDELFASGLNDLVFDEYTDHLVGEFVRQDPVCKKYSIAEQSPGVPLFANKNVKSKRICITPPIDGEGNTLNRKLVNHCGAAFPKLEKPLRQTCSILFRDFYVRFDGKVPLCCNDFRGEYFVTDMKECSTFAQAWFHERLESARRYLMAKERANVYPCSVCSTIPLRPGLLPDARGELELEKPSMEDFQVVSRKYEPLSKIIRRPYEDV